MSEEDEDRNEGHRMLGWVLLIGLVFWCIFLAVAVSQLLLRYHGSIN